MSDLISVAKLAGVSRATAARAFSDPHLLRADTLEKVLSASEQLGFRPNHIARQLRTQSSTTFGVLLPSLLNPIFARQLQAMERQARAAGYGLLVATSDYQPEREAAIVEHMLNQRVAGLVLTVADADNSAILHTLHQASMPFVLTHNVPQETHWPAICVDNRQAMQEATEHLLQLGHRHIGMVAGPMLQSDRARLRYQGYCDVMQQAGLDALPVIEMPSHTQSDFTLLQPQLSGDTPLSAVICTNDLLAISLIGDAARAGVRIPQQLSVMGFDGIDIGEHIAPSLASVSQPADMLGAGAIDMLLQQASRGTRVLPHRLRLGASIAAPATTFSSIANIREPS
ncbi:substrate-binding domain-containing protein [Pantoea trifolii]|uniref:Substrate-binding domain-containing protein n=1 Tax=Pantoea trifolii TaxID=2968030 RepID=A0ABT1VNY1_9GAMM|nr:MULTISPECIES: substrate-binding domain-containing protein [unclassified Pantoea]MCQ8228603.1 substrate-binding domain-containing protein [Pantoea sp. MMK2]MCQ8236776.1 substrate-binding domain-containing protein [Pantoea sp. MMK3]